MSSFILRKPLVLNMRIPRRLGATVGVLAVLGGVGGVLGSQPWKGPNTPPVVSGSQFSGPFSCYGINQSCYTSAVCTGAPYTLNSGANILTSITNAPAGTVICLNNGSYAGFTISGVNKISDVIVQPTPGQAATITSPITINTSSHLKFQGLTIAGGTLGQPTGIGTSGAQIGQYITLDHIAFTGSVSVVNRAAAPAVHLLINGSTFYDLGPARWEGRLSFDCNWENCSTNPDIVVSNNIFANLNTTSDANGNCSDGVGSSADSYGITVGPGNEFTGLAENSCVAHVDPIQPYAGSNWTITGNYFHDNGNGSGGIMNPDGSPGLIITNNVLVGNGGYAYSINNSGDNVTVQHNVFTGPWDAAMHLANGQTPTGDILRDNVFVNGAGATLDTGYGTADHNLNCGCAGTGNISGSPTFQIGGIYTGYYAFIIASNSSVGYNAASDGKSMGITP